MQIRQDMGQDLYTGRGEGLVSNRNSQARPALNSRSPFGKSVILGPSGGASPTRLMTLKPTRRLGVATTGTRAFSCSETRCPRARRCPPGERSTTFSLRRRSLKFSMSMPPSHASPETPEAASEVTDGLRGFGECSWEAESGV